MKTSIRLNNDLSSAELVTLIETAEQAGFDQIWVSNDLMLRSAPVLIGAFAARTERIGLGIGIMNPYTVHPTELAMIAATAQELSGGRFLLGVAAGAEEFLRWAGLPRTQPLRTTRQAVAALRKMLGHQDVRDADLPDWWNENSMMKFFLPAPVPVYVGAMGPKMRMLAGEVGDGALCLLFPPESYGQSLADVRAGLDKAGRSAAAFDMPACVWVSVGEPGPAHRALAAKLAYFGSSLSPYQLAAVGLTAQDLQPAAELAFAGNLDAAVDLVDDRALSLGIAGTPEDVVERCVALAGHGVDHISFGPPLGVDPVAALKVLGAEVIPALRARTS